MVKDKVDEAIETLVDNEPSDVSYNELLQCLCELTDKDFKNLIKIAKLERRTNKLIDQYFNNN
nr:MAG TPA: hypothetical protein [Caudoviricetes sp.]